MTRHELCPHLSAAHLPQPYQYATHVIASPTLLTTYIPSQHSRHHFSLRPQQARGNGGAAGQGARAGPGRGAGGNSGVKRRQQPPICGKSRFGVLLPIQAVAVSSILR